MDNNPEPMTANGNLEVVCRIVTKTGAGEYVLTFGVAGMAKLFAGAPKPIAIFSGVGVASTTLERSADRMAGTRVQVTIGP